jgi:monothiol glutaredoxin
MSNDNPFNILKSDMPQAKTREAVQETDKSGELKERIKRLISSSDLFLFMKGSPDFPQCGFSANVIGILDNLGAEYKTFDILSDADIRQGVKDYANWPTYPQLWLKGTLVGGNDIIAEMFHSGDLEKLLK